MRAAQARSGDATTTREHAVDASFRDGEVVPALIAAAAEDQPAAVRREALLALAEIGAPALERADALRDFEHLARTGARAANRSLIEASVLALGLAGSDAGVRELVHVLHGCDDGRVWIGKDRIGDRERALAAYALGLAAEASPIHDLRRYVVHHLELVLENREWSSPDVRAACVQAMGLAAVPWCGLAPEEADARVPADCRESQLAFLAARVEDRREERVVRAHAATACARLLEGADEAWRASIGLRLCMELEDRGAPNELSQSLALALGAIGDADRDVVDRRVRRALERAIGGTDRPTRHFAILALGECAARPGSGDGDPLHATGGVRRDLLSRLARGKPSQRPWAGLALGLLGEGLASRGAAPVLDASGALATSLDGAASPDEIGAYALALGLRRDGQERGALEELVGRYGGRDEARGHIALALGMLGAGNAREVLHATLADATDRPWVLRQTAVALALLDDRGLSDRLATKWIGSGSLPARLGLAHALGRVGGGDAARLLLAQLAESSTTDAVRAACAGALGEIHARGELPWQARYAAGANYLAGTRLFGAGSSEGLLAMP